MKTAHYRWLINPLFLLFTATCGNDGLANNSCPANVDTDGDGLSDDIECQLGSDPSNADTNGDGISDGTAYSKGLDPTKLDNDNDGVSDALELNYPRVCVATVANLQRPTPPPLRTGQTPLPACTTDADCLAGETCNGLDPTKSDSDGDGIPDGQEDLNSDGMISFSSGETDPRLYDTDGDGQSDATSGAAICRPDGLGMVTQNRFSSIQLGSDPAFGTAVSVNGATGGRSAVVVNDATTQVAGLVISSQTRGVDVRADATAIEADIKTALTAVAGTTVTNILTQSSFTTHEGNSALRSLLLVTTMANANASDLRDSVVNRLTGGTAPTSPVVGTATSFYLDVTTVRRASTFNDIIIAVSPSAMYNDNTKATALRVEDLVNATDVAEATRSLDYVCQGLLASRQPMADFIWAVDTSGSMDDDQDRLGQAATKFFKKMTDAGVDMRVGVFQSGAGTVNFTTTVANIWPSGFEFILGSDPNGPSKLARYVTDLAFTGTGGDNPNLRPFPITGGNAGQEEPVAAGILINTEFKRRASIGDTNPNYTLRTGATKVAFFVTDEPTAAGTTGDANDWLRYFNSTNNPDTNTPWATGGNYGNAVLDGIVQYWKSNNFLTYGMVPAYTTRACKPTVAASTIDLPRCVIEGNGGAYIDIAQATNQTVVDAALDRIANDVIGASSPIVLQRSPITHTIKVTVRGITVPRSRSNGFDYNQASKSIVFYGNMYRPNVGDVVYVSYRVWKDAIG